MTDEEKVISKLEERVFELEKRIIAKDRENAILQDQHEDEVGHKDFMINGLTRDKEALAKKVMELESRLQAYDKISNNWLFKTLIRLFYGKGKNNK